MSDISEKIMAIERPRYCRVDAYSAGFEDALKSSADIAEAEVARLEARVRELEENIGNNGCPHREEYRHDGGNYYKCNKRENYDCFDSYSDCVSRYDIEDNCPFSERVIGGE